MTYIFLVGLSLATSKAFASDVADNIYNVTQSPFNAYGDGIHDDTAAISLAIAAASTASRSVGQSGGTVLLPTGTYLVSSTITVPTGVTLTGVNGNSRLSSATTILLAASSLSTVVALDGGPGSGSVSLQNLSIFRSGTTVPAGSVAVNVTSQNYTVMQDVNISGHDIGYSITGGLGFKAYRVLVYNSTTAYAKVSDSPQATFIDCSFGRNGTTSPTYAFPTSAVILSSGADTISFLRCQFYRTLTNGLYFQGYSNPNGIVYMTNCHMEGPQSAITSDQNTTQIQRVLITGSTINLGTSYNLVTLNSATTPVEWGISNNEITAQINFTHGGAVSITDNRIVGNFSIAGSSFVVSGNKFYSSGNVTGNFSNLVFSNNVFDGTATTLDDSLSTGRKAILGNVSIAGYSNSQLLPDNYLKLGTGTSFAVQRFTGTLDINGHAAFAHGIWSGHRAGLIAQAFWKGNSGEMKSMNVDHVDGDGISISGGGANRPYRVTFIYSNELDPW